MTRVSPLLSAIEALMPPIEPHPDLVASTVATSAQVTQAAGILGLFPSDDDRPDWPMLGPWIAGKAVCE